MVWRLASKAPRSIAALSVLVIFNSCVRRVSQVRTPATPGSALNSAHRARKSSHKSAHVFAIFEARWFSSRIAWASCVCFVSCCAANRSAASLDQSDMAVPSDLPGLRINITLPPDRSSIFGAKSAIDSRRSGRLEVQTIIPVVEGKSPNFFVVKVVKCPYEFCHKVAVFREP